MATDLEYLQRALVLAQMAKAHQEVPVGAVLVLDDQIIGEGWNQPISCHDPTAHAEILALRQGAEALSNYRLLNTTLYCTLEPCAMCAAAMVHARVKRLVFAAADPKAGAAGSVFDLLNSEQLNHRVEVQRGELVEPCGDLLREFFAERRNS